MSGELKKFLIEAYTSDKYDKGQKPVKSFEAMINPTSYTIKHEIQFQDAQGKGNSGSPQVYDKMKPREFTFDFIIDGTGVTGVKKDVSTEVKNFLDTAFNLDGDIHRPRYLKLWWGPLVSYCVLKTADVAYNLFDSNAKPLRAKITASFSENIEDTKRAAQDRLSSPDLTHYKTVMQGDTLPLQTFRQYGDHTYYLQVAKVNKFKNFRKLNVGSQIIFPPMSGKKSE